MSAQAAISSCWNGIRNRPAWALLLVAHAPFTCIYFRNLWKYSPHYHFFPFAILAFVWLFSKRRDSEQEQWTLFPRILIGLDVALLVLGTVIFSPWVVVVGLFLSLVAWCWASRDNDYERRLTYLALLPALLVRLPRNGDVRLTDVLQSVTTEISSRLLLRLDFLHLRQGNVLQFADRRFLVEEACSGVQSLFTILFLAGLIVCWKRRSLAYACLFIPSGMVFAGIMNVMRITTIAVAWEQWRIDLSEGIAHDVLGYACLTIAAALLLSADMFLAFLTEAVPDVKKLGPASDYYNPWISIWNALFGFRRRRSSNSTAAAQQAELSGSRSWLPQFIGAGLLCCVVVALQGSAILGAAHATSRPKESTGLAIVNEGNLQAEVSGFQQIDYTEEQRSAGSDTGEFSNIWRYANPEHSAMVSCDHPFSGWHSLEDCYIRTGWHVDSMDTIDGADGWRAVLVRLSKLPGERSATLVYSLFDSSGRSMQPPGLNPFGAAGFEHLLRNRRIGLLDGTAIQSQVFSESVRPLSDEDVQQLVQLHFACREQMRQAILKSRGDQRAQ